MPRYKLTIEYDGGPFVGWQRQANGRSVQQAIEEALARLVNETPTLRGAGRTDAGVHALGQVAHFDLARAWPGDKLRDGLNAHLRPEPIAILPAEPVAEGFDARYSAIRRHYRYRILIRRAPPVIDRGRVWHFGADARCGCHACGGATLLGTHDFTTFRSTECQAKSPVRTLDVLDVTSAARKSSSRRRRAPSCTTRCARMVGSLKLVGEGKWSAADLERRLTRATAPPQARSRRPMGFT